MTVYEYIASRLTEDSILCQLAEEASELAKAALKLRRERAQDNPTPVTEEEAITNLIEEFADTLNAFRAWEQVKGFGMNLVVNAIADEKCNIWAGRLMEAERGVASEKECDFYGEGV